MLFDRFLSGSRLVGKIKSIRSEKIEELTRELEQEKNKQDNPILDQSKIQ